MDQIPHILACDIGNSAVHLAHVQGETVGPMQAVRTGELDSLGKKLAELWQEIPSPKKLVAGSVNAAALKSLKADADELLHEPVLVVGQDLPLPMDIDLDEPAAAGTDRLCCAVAAFDRLGAACVVADFGTAVTIDCVSNEGVFLGGAIMPGLAMGAESLHAGTDRLPRIRLSRPEWVLGKNTHQAIVAGLVHGARGALRELTEAYATELGHWPTVILTGGDAKLICPDPSTCQLVQAVVPDLAVRGVAIAYYKTLLKNDE